MEYEATISERRTLANFLRARRRFQERRADDRSREFRKASISYTAAYCDLADLIESTGGFRTVRTRVRFSPFNLLAVDRIKEGQCENGLPRSYSWLAGSSA